MSIGIHVDLEPKYIGKKGLNMIVITPNSTTQILIPFSISCLINKIEAIVTPIRINL